MVAIYIKNILNLLDPAPNFCFSLNKMKTATKQKVKRYAFWKYDLFPYMLSGEIIGQCKVKWPGKDYYEIAGYGKGYYFRPFLIIRGAKGEKLKKCIEILGVQYRQAQLSLRLDYNQKLLDMHPDFKNVLSVLKV